MYFHDLDLNVKMREVANLGFSPKITNILPVPQNYIFIRTELFDTWGFNLYGRGTGGISPKLSDTVRPTPCHTDTHQKTASHVGYLSLMLI